MYYKTSKQFVSNPDLEIINILPQIKISSRHMCYEVCPKDYRILGCIESVSSEMLLPIYKTARWHMAEEHNRSLLPS